MNQLAVIAILISLFLLVGCPRQDTVLPFSPQDIVLPSGQAAQVLGKCNSWSDISMVAGDKVHLVYNTANNTLGYAEKSGENWREKKTWAHSGPSDHYGLYNSLVLDKDGNVHIACSESEGNDENLRYFNNVSGLFTTSQPASLRSVGIECKIAVDKNGRVHIAHWYWNDSMVLYTTNVSGRWQTSEVAQSNLPVAILIDSQNVVYLLYFGAGLQYVSNAGDGWRTEGQIANSAFTTATAAAIDQDDTIYVVTGVDLFIRPKGGRWQNQNLGQLFSASPSLLLAIDFKQNSLVVEANGNLHLAYMTLESLDKIATSYRHVFYHATNSSGQWQRQEIGSLIVNDYFQSRPVLAIDSAGTVYYAYARNEDLVFLALE